MRVKIKSKKVARRLRTKAKVRSKITGTDVKPRVCVFRSSKHIYAQIISDESAKTYDSVSTLQKHVQEDLASAKPENKDQAKSTKSTLAAHAVGVAIAGKLKEHGFESAVFDRNGFKFQGRIKSLAEGINSAGFKI